jgi:pimeloyl-ACP methyl ester carboxylesterase
MERDKLKLSVQLMFAAAVLAMSQAAFAQTRTDCPGDLQKLARCYTGIDQNGSHYWIAIPEQWNNTLVMHAHGGPRLSAIKRDSSLEDLERFAVTVRQGYAWAGSSYRRPGYGVRMAAEDTENLRHIFIKAFGKPKRTILHGQSWGGNVAAKGIELYGKAEDGSRSYDGVILTNGMIAGGTRNYLHRADLRAVYQYYCRNHPLPDEPQYPLWMGLPAESKMTGKDLEARVNECTGVKLPAAQRSEAQAKNLANILGVIRVPERTLVSHLGWATFMFRDLTQRVLGGKNPFSNADVVYRGSDDDAALNKNVLRFSADPEAVAALAKDSDMAGAIDVPVMTMHAIDDPTAMVEYETEYRRVVTAAGKQDLLMQTFTREHEHSKLSDAEYAALFETLDGWIASGKRPETAQVEAACGATAKRFDGGCHFDLQFVPKALFTRVAPREKEVKAP